MERDPKVVHSCHDAIDHRIIPPDFIPKGNCSGVFTLRCSTSVQGGFENDVGWGHCGLARWKLQVQETGILSTEVRSDQPHFHDIFVAGYWNSRIWEKTFGLIKHRPRTYSIFDTVLRTNPARPTPDEKLSSTAARTRNIGVKFERISVFI